MIIRVSSGKSGVVDYLENGLKQHREHDRNALDKRECIDGDLLLTDSIIKELHDSKGESNYLHITLSFAEKDISSEQISNAYLEFKDKLLSAYDASEFNIYAEIHHPKIKSYHHARTNERISRFPHVHVVLPTKNLLTDNALNPFGHYRRNVEHLEAIQEHINRKFNLESPYDHQRKYRLSGKDDILSRHKGDAFKGSHKDIKQTIFDTIHEKNIQSYTDFKQELTKFGVVSVGLKGTPQEYLKVKPHNQTRNIRLTEPVFTQAYVTKRQLERVKPSDKKVASLVKEWEGKRAFEMKHIHTATPSFRKKYYSANASEKEILLNDRIENFRRKYNLQPKRRPAYHQPRLTRDRQQTFAQIPNGLPGMPRGFVVRRESGQRIDTQGVLQSNETHHLDANRTSQHHQLRRINDRRGARVTSLSSQFNNELTQSQIQKTDRERFSEIRHKLRPETLLKKLESSHGITSSDYMHYQTRAGGRIKVGNRSLNVSDFLTKHLHLKWDDAKDILTESYQSQQTQRQEDFALNSISSISKFTTQQVPTHKKLDRIEESLIVFRLLKAKEKYGEKTMEDKRSGNGNFFQEENAISQDSPLSLVNLNRNFQHQKELADRLTLKMTHVVAEKNLEKGQVNYLNANTGEELFVDKGSKLTFSRTPDDNAVAIGMTLAAEKFGKVKIDGTKEFKQQAVDIAVAKDLNIVFADKKMQESFIQLRDEFRKNEELEKIALKEGTQSTSTNSQSQSDVSGKITQMKDQQQGQKVVDFGSAPYLFNENNKDSFYVKFEDGKNIWGVGLKEALEKANVERGDYINAEKTGETLVKVEAPTFDEKGEFNGIREIETKRNSWHVDKLEKVETNTPSELNESKSMAKGVDNQAQYKLDFKYSTQEQKLIFTVNDKQPNEFFNKDQIEKIQKDDPLLAKYPADEVLKGRLDLKMAGDKIDAVKPRTLDFNLSEIKPMKIDVPSLSMK